MDTIEMTILEMYDINALIFGFHSPQFSTPGILNEPNPNLKESTKRAVAKAGKVIKSLLIDIDEQRAKIREFVPEGFDAKVDERISPEEQKIAKEKIDLELAPIRKEKEDELLKSSEKVQIEMPLFSLVSDLSFPNNYTFLYEKIFKE